MYSISATTKLICLLGSPVDHSISPAMHNAAFAALGLNYVYLAFDVRPGRFSDAATAGSQTGEDEGGKPPADFGSVQTALNALKLFDARGCNLTMPLKKAVIPYLDELSEAARLSGAVNTIVHENGRLTGHTTDGAGYIDALKKEDNFDINGKRLTILGAGGAAESIIVQAALDGAASIHVFKRKNSTYAATVNFAKKVTDTTNCAVTVSPMEDRNALKHSIAASDLLCNATNVGMGDDKRSLVPKSFFHRNLFVSDIIYHPEETTLLKDAKAAGCRCANGKYMLLYQGAAAFTLWTGQNMPVDIVKEKYF